MNNINDPEIREVIDRLHERGHHEFRALLGFDACIDNILRVVKQKDENKSVEFFNNSREFGEYLIQHENMSCGIEMRTRLSKVGGNMVITGNALGNLGIKSDCIGTFGFPQILPVFRSMSSNCKLHTIGETITASALEFDDSKVIMYDPGPYAGIDWNVVKSRINTEQIKNLFSGKHLIAFLNWSEIENTSDIWNGIYNEILPFILKPEHEDTLPVLFADLADCSRRTSDEILTALLLLGRFRENLKVILSLNQNEANIVAKALNISGNENDKDFIKELFSACNVSGLIIHRVKDALGYNGKLFEKCDTFYCEKPEILTGGGDNFNAGFCFATLCGFTLYQSLAVANAVSGYYVRTGISPDIGQLEDFLRNI